MGSKQLTHWNSETVQWNEMLQGLHTIQFKFDGGNETTKLWQCGVNDTAEFWLSGASDSCQLL